MDEVADWNNALRNIAEARCRVLDDSFRNYSYEEARGIMTVFSPIVNPKVTKNATAVQNVHVMKLL